MRGQCLVDWVTDMMASSLGAVFEAVLGALDDAAPDVLEEIGRKYDDGVREELANYQRVLGMVLAYANDEIKSGVEDLGWLVVSLSEFGLCWQGRVGVAEMQVGEKAR